MFRLTSQKIWFLKTFFPTMLPNFMVLPNLKKFLHWASKGTVFQFNGQLFTQTNGVYMGSPIALLLTDMCMNWILDQILNVIMQPRILVRYVNDNALHFS